MPPSLPGAERDTVASAVAELVTLVRQGSGASLFVIGEAGLGKTAVLDHGCALAAPDVVVAAGCGDAAESDLPLGLFGQATAALRRAHGRTGARLAQDDLLAGAVPFHEVLQWLEELAQTPVLLVLDDLHLADPQTAALVGYLCRRLAGLPVGVLAAARPWPPRGADIALALEHDRLARVERLQPLGGGGARALIAAALHHPPTEAALDRAVRLCGGNPLLLHHVARAIDSGAGPGVAAVHRVLLDRFVGESEAGMLWLHAAAVLGVRFHTGVATAMVALDPAESNAVLESLDRSGLLRHAGGGHAVFVHPLLRLALYEDLGPSMRARLHARAFAELARRGDHPLAAEHALIAGMPGDAAVTRSLEIAGREALTRGAPREAVRHLRAATERTRGSPSVSLLTAFGDSLVSSGGLPEAIRTFESVLRAADCDPASRLVALRRLGRARALTGEADSAMRCFEEAARLAGPEDSAETAAVLLDQAALLGSTASPGAGLSAATAARALAAAGDRRHLGRAGAMCAYLGLLTGDASELHAPGRVAALAESVQRSPERRTAWGALAALAAAATWIEGFDDAERVLDAVMDVEQTGTVSSLGVGAALRAQVLLRRGQLLQAHDHSLRAVTLPELEAAARPFAEAVHAQTLLHLQRLPAGGSWYERLDGDLAASGLWISRLLLWDVRGQLLLDAGQAAESSRLYARLQEQSLDLGIAEPCAVPWARHAIAAHLGCGRDREAWVVVDWLERCAERLPCRWPRIAAAAGRARLASRRGDHARAADEYEHALALHREVQLPLDEIVTLVDYGSLLRRSGHPVEARRRLRTALQLAEVSAATWLRRRAAQELAAAGGRRRRAPGLHLLTPQERRVAELAATGFTNRELAAQLQISPSTVDSHLKRIYSKLGIHSRRQLNATRIDTAAPSRDRRSA